MCGGDSFGPRYAAEQPARYNGESPHFVDDVCDRWSGLRVLRLPPTNCVGRTLIRTRTGLGCVTNETNQRIVPLAPLTQLTLLMKLGQIYVNTRCKPTGKVARYAFNVIKVLLMLARFLRTYFGRLKVT